MNSSKATILQGHSRPIKDTTFTKGGEIIFTGSNDRNVIRWNTETGEKGKNYMHSAAVNIIRLVKNDAYMITGDNTGCVYLWDVEKCDLLKKLEQDPTLCIRSIDISSDDELMMITYAGRMKGAGSFINVYKLQDVFDYKDSNDKEGNLENGEIDNYDNLGVGAHTNNNNNNSSTSNKKNRKGSNHSNRKGSNHSNRKDSNNSNNEMSNTSGLMIKPMKSKSNPKPEFKTITIPDTFPPFKRFDCACPNITKYVHAKFAIMNKSLVVSREDGFLELINFMNGKIITQSKFHDDIILDFDVNPAKGLILTASRDGTACVINLDTFQVVNKFHPQNPTRNLNTCRLAIIPNPNYTLNKSDDKSEQVFKVSVDGIFDGNGANTSISNTRKEIIVAIVSGGQDSKLVTTTNQKEGGFEIIIYDVLEGTEVANFITHFGPVNTLAVSSCNMLASGAEDATVRLYKLENYLFPSNV